MTKIIETSKDGDIKIRYSVNEDHRFHGLRITWHRKYKWWPFSYRLAKSETYDDGDLEGEFKCWYKNGQLQIHSYFTNDKREGSYKEWHENGELSIYCFFSNGEKNGRHKEWRDDGRMKIDSHFREGWAHGQWREWSYDGHIWEDCFYVKGNSVQPEIRKMVEDISNITEEEKLLIKLHFGIESC